MKSRVIFLPLFLISFSFFFLTSCKDKTTENKPDPHTELHASAAYQCPMDCEDGKTYEEAGSCPVCKMDLKAVGESNMKRCAMHEGGECSCEGDACKCANCKQHANAKACAMHEGGECSCEGDACKCENCPVHT
ncbi:MAG: heavy metal-binding domain-containing protein [Maribacter sp.]|uniref:heavy metal-binding domain-containing protein n=1 Tax=Maribacter sp. TaxID=1897614 RepID=UPI003C717879